MNTTDSTNVRTRQGLGRFVRYAALLGSLTLLLLPVQTQAADLTQSLVAYYPFEGNANDASGRGHNGVAQGGLSYKAGVAGQAGYFNGIDAFIRVANSTDFRMEAADDKSFVFWCRVDASAYFKQTILSRCVRGQSGMLLWEIRQFGNWVSVGYTPSHWGHFEVPSALPNGWSCIAYVKSASTWTVYQNGKPLSLVRADSWPYGGSAEADVDLLIGIEFSPPDPSCDCPRPFKGWMDELRIYNRALSPGEVMALYQNPGGQPVVSQPVSQTSCVGQSVAFAVTATGAGPFAYQWYFNDTLLSGQTSSVLTLTNLRSDQTGSYQVVVKDNYGQSTTSTPATLIVGDACIELKMYAGMNISGEAGRTYELRYTTDLSNTNLATWTPLATNVMSSSGWFCVDRESASSPRRFYAVRLQP